MKKLLILTVVLLLTAGLAVSAAAKDKYEIVMVVKLEGVAWFDNMRLGIEQFDKDFPDVHAYQIGADTADPAAQVALVEDLIAKGVDAIGISCNDPTGCEDPINKAIAAGIPVMTWDSDSPDSDRFTYLGVDNYQGGVAAADLLVRLMGEEGKVALLTGVPGAFNLEERIRGFQDSIAPYPGIEIVTTVYCNDDINLGVQVVEETMQAYPDLDGWFFVGLWPLFAERGSMPLWEGAAESG